jgi:8-oxo-dGTP diphosphatase
MYSWETSVVLVSDADRGVLLVRQRYGHRFYGLPGGVIEKGESPARAAERELFEETGLRAEGLRAAGTRELIYPEDGSWGSGKCYLAHIFTAERVIGTPVPQMPDEIESVDWYPIDDLPTPLTPSATAVLVQPGAAATRPPRARPTASRSPLR